MLTGSQNAGQHFNDNFNQYEQILKIHVKSQGFLH